jgi:hypothetical protein
MKKIVLIITVLILLLTGCRYEEGSAFTSVEKRIRGMWSVSSVYKNGEKTDTESPTVVEAKNSTYEFFKNKILTITYYHNNIDCQSSGSWLFGEKKKTIELTLVNQYYPISRSYEIIKFTNKELKVRFTDDDGIKWTLILSLEQDYVPYDW